MLHRGWRVTSRAARLPSPRGSWSSSESERISRKLLETVRDVISISACSPRVLKKVGYNFGMKDRQIIMTMDRHLCVEDSRYCLRGMNGII